MSLEALVLFGHVLEVGRVHFTGLAVLDVLNAADEIVSLQLEVDGLTVFHCITDLTLGVRLH